MLQLTNDAFVIEQLECAIEESLLVNLKLGNEAVILLVIYNSPRADKMRFIDEFDKTLECLVTKFEKIVVCGDFNIDTLKDNLLTRKYLNGIKSNGCEICYHQATRIGPQAMSCLDHFIINNNDVIQWKVLSDHCFSEHFPTILSINLQTNKHCITQKFRDTSFLIHPQN